MTANDEPTEISKRFCKKKGFSTDLVAPLAEQIKMNMDKFFGKTTAIPPLTFTDRTQQMNVSERIKQDMLAMTDILQTTDQHFETTNNTM